ncbi:heme o synthase [Blochmannia endosymbiont of Camponotus sp.]|uniref:heme o synthase n=1 Tax=Blochmannia endosymbiont of Camponotus sp. TaxID=700220 RepID=UPI0020258406|nr:heme o synthase [Blochmannia endosymbiont of Camponotus sp.]URJ30135.1 heme o synthase [Blochmannia endosymbiont of Camponotus sp.]
MNKHYLHLIKPGIVIGNLMSAIGGFLIASRGHIHYLLFIEMIIGISLVIAASCLLNNIIDRDIDSVMERTKNRVLAQHSRLFLNKSILYALILSVFGFLCLIYTKNFLIVYLAAIGLFTYVGIYSLWMKRKSIYSIIVGSISGAMPPVIGYCAVTNRFDMGALILLMIFSLWQIPHSYSIAILRLHDYKAARIPTFPIKKGIKSTKNHMIVYIIGFIIATILLTVMRYTSYIFLIIISIMNLWWLYIGSYGYKIINNDSLWARRMFQLSIIIVVSLNLFLSLDPILFHM